MIDLSSIDMLNVWEQGLNKSLLHKALILLLAANPDLKPASILELSIGERDKALLLLREQLFGSKLVNTAVCPECSERIEWENTVSEVIASPHDTLTKSSAFNFKLDSYEINFRLPNSLDLDAVIGENDLSNAQEELLLRCIVSAKLKRKKVLTSKLPAKVLSALGQRIQELDPQAEISIALNCPECSHAWDVLFDIVSFLWAELNAWAERTLKMVHVLASSYGWTEQEIFNTSPVRRQLYLTMVSS